MARTKEQILREQIGQLYFLIAELQAELEQLRAKIVPSQKDPAA